MIALTPRQKQILAGGLTLALGVVTGLIVAPDDPQREDKLVELGSALGSASTNPGTPIDVPEYNRVVGDLKRGRNDITDVMSEEVAPGKLATTSVNVERGATVEAITLTGLADDRFSMTCGGCGWSVLNGSDYTTIKIVAENTSQVTLRLTAIVHCTPRCFE